MNKSNKRLVLFSTVAFLAILAIFPSVMAYSGTVYPNVYQKRQGQLMCGTLDSFKYIDQDFMWLQGHDAWWCQFFIEIDVYFPINYDNVSDGNTLKLVFIFIGGNVLDVKIYYTDGTSVLYHEAGFNQVVWKTVIYNLDSDKVVHYVHFFNHEWWYAGHLFINQLIVNY